jgi:hypothetical protein
VLFGTACTPRNPIGSCMVSAEGACAAYYKYRRGAVRAADVPARAAGDAIRAAS